MFKYPVDLIDDGGTVLVKFPDIPEAVTFGQDREEALGYAVNALETALMIYIDKRWPLPRQSSLNGRAGVSPTPLSCLKLAIYQAMIEKNLRKVDLARMLGGHMPQIDRLLDLNHESRMNQLERSLAVLGRQMVVDVRELVV
ncbi:type II toxin-antitoxin system HicB family antitoxin [bacterium]|nr:type II toxin-antitoxin system HicB family antitoxin [bacterium]